MENPGPFAGSHIECVYISLHVLFTLGSGPIEEGRPDQNNILGHYWSGLQSDLSFV